MDNESISLANVSEEILETDVIGVNSDGTYCKGIDKFPIFDVPAKEFHANMEDYRTRLRLSGKAGEYLRNTRYKKPFYIRTVDANNKTYIRKVK